MPSPLKIIKVDDADLQPTNTLDQNFDDATPLTSSQVKIKKIDKNFFGKQDNKPSGGGGNQAQNGITFMGSQIASFNDIPTMNSKIGPPGGFKLPSLPGLPGLPKLPPFAPPGKHPFSSKIFDPNV